MSDDDPFLPPSAFFSNGPKKDALPPDIPAPLRELLERLQQAGTQVIVGPPDPEQAASMGTKAFGTASDAIHRHSAFNPNGDPAYVKAHDDFDEVLQKIGDKDAETPDEAVEITLSALGLDSQLRAAVITDVVQMVSKIMQTVFSPAAAQRIAEETCLGEEITMHLVGYFAIGLLTERNRNAGTAVADPHPAEGHDPDPAQGG